MIRIRTTASTTARRLRALGLGGGLALALLITAPAAADESPAPPRHLAPYGLDWIAYIAPEDLPPTRAAVCLVDSGVAITPDTPPDSPDGPILERLSIDGGSGEPQGAAPEQLHGTRMAMAAIAPQNGWGTIGVWPQGKIVSVRAMVNGETYFRPEAYRRGIQECVEHAERWNIAVINLSLACDCEVSDAERAAIDDGVESARSMGISVVAAAGNRPGPVGVPANASSVLAIAAGDAAGGRCAYAAFDWSVDVVGPACPVDSADPLDGSPRFDDSGGSSTASAAAASATALVRTLRPDASMDAVEGWLRSSAAQVSDAPRLHGTRLAAAAGLDAVVERARARMVRPEAPAAAGPVAAAGGGPTTAASPAGSASAEFRARVRWRAGRLRIAVTGRPTESRLSITARWYRGFRLVRRARRARLSSRATLRFRRRPDRVDLRWVAPDGLPSRRLVLYPTRTGRFR